MKILLLVHIIPLLLCGCGLVKVKDEVQKFIPGTYTRFSAHEYGTEYDTLVISIQNSSAGEYRIVRRWKYERITNDGRIEPDYKIKVSSGIYIPKHRLLQETETGDFFSFDVRKKILFDGPVKYEKL